LLSAGDGYKGESSNKAGAHGQDRIVMVPVGTIIKDEEQNIQFDLKAHNQRVVICRGGDGGFGNAHFKNRLCSAPEKATPGFKGEERELSLVLKLMADVGLLGFPNAGKSTLLSHISNARPKVADYPFTTIKPMVGVCEIEPGRTMVIADIPGLIEGASEGLGLGFRFLRHLERVKVLCHLIDASDESSLIDRYETIQRELNNYSQELAVLPQIVAINKMDVVFGQGDLARVLELEKYLSSKQISSVRISAVTSDGLSELQNELYKKVKNISQIPEDCLEIAASFDPTINLY
jgi:GTP-binding protein